LYEALNQFGFGRKTGIDIGTESSGLNPSREWKRSTMGQPWYPGETLISGIGQGYILSTPLQLAMATSVLANRGQRITPRLVRESRDPINNEFIRYPAESGGQLRIKNTQFWDDIIAAMVDVVHGVRGTARSSGLNAAYRIAGKTGTAQVIGIAQDEKYDEEEIDERLKDHAWFIAFAPVEDPEIAMAILVENGGGGSRTAAPIARILLDHYLAGKTRS
ncbi:MAG: penicillin-binding protein 2, partial [Thiotrichales bacterium]|nr:penicillin-binding protein 2 [Thiotrichales bacterium]